MSAKPSWLSTATAISWHCALELFKYPRSMAVTVLTSLGSQTAGNGIGLWAPTLLVLLLKIPPSEASFLLIFAGLAGFVGRLFFSYTADAIGRRPSGILLSLGGALSLILAGFYHDAFIGGVSVFFLMLLAQGFFNNGGNHRPRPCSISSHKNRGTNEVLSLLMPGIYSTVSLRSGSSTTRGRMPMKE